MRVLYFTRDFSPHDHRILTALAASSHQVYSLRLERRGMQREDRPLPLEIEQVQWIGGTTPVQRSDGPRLVMDLNRVIRKIKPDIVHAGTVQTAAFLAALTGFHPLVTMSWGSDLLVDADRDSSWRWATRFTLDRTDVLIDDCQTVSKKAQSFGFPAERIVTFPWGVDLGQFQPQNGTAPDGRFGKRSAFVLLSLRSWEPIYGVDIVAKAFAKAARQVPELVLLLAGGGSQATSIRKILMDEGVMDRVSFTGQVSNDDLPKFYRAADLYLSASYSDGSSVSLMEALACGLPALVSDIPGNLEWITPGKQGWLFKTGDADDLARRIVYAVQQRDELETMKLEARALADQRADWVKNFAQLMRAYDLAVERRRKR
jgi:L-malate glycosyltransferase